MLDTILFDLDGTLLPISHEKFTKEYFRALAKKIVPMGYEKDEFVKAIWMGTKAMQSNDGSALNRDKFWETFTELLGGNSASLEEVIDDFYKNEFNDVKSCIERQEDHGELIKNLKAKGFCLVLASNPVFPKVAVRTRLSWIGIDADDFDYITHYYNSSYCKPSIGYYEEILRNVGKDADECIMIGNNPVEDGAAFNLGTEVFIVNEIPEGDTENCEYPTGSLEDAVEYVLSL